ncbi:MAG: tRNA pseudouridine(13) synthase TruD [Pseudomonadales bacterium]|nr:tRNA pseudouridine(13) synthase TruD [Pseudomonadales bacterium]
MSYSIDFKRAYGAVLGQGSIRQQPEDFKVTEILGFEPCGEGEHLYLLVNKIGANTGWVGEQLARFLGLRHFDVGYAGKKDRHAVTQQWFSCWLPDRPEIDWSKFSVEGVEILKAVRHLKKLRHGVHVGNRFELKIKAFDFSAPGSPDHRGTGPDESAYASVEAHNKQLLEERLRLIADQGFPNYFGPQRFGHNGQNLLCADELFRGDKVNRKKKGLYLSAARSYIFNRELEKKIQAVAWQRSESLWLYGLAPHRDIIIPPLAAEFSNWADGLERLGVKAMQRDLVAYPTEMDWAYTGDVLELEFCLPRSAYATSLLHELIDYVDESVMAHG